MSEKTIQTEDQVEDLHYDELPAPEDDVVQEVKELAPEAPEVVEEPESKVDNRSPNDAKRSEIYDLYEQAKKKARQEDQEERDLPPRDEKGRFVKSEQAEEEAPAEERGESRPEPQEEIVEDHGKKYTVPEPQEEETITLIVNGQEVQMNRSDVVKNAQMNLAAEDKLQQAKDLYAAVKQQASEPQQDQQEVQPEDQNTEPEPQPEPVQYQPDKERLAKIVEDIQIGDTEDGLNAMQELVSMMTEAAQVNQPVPQEPVSQEPGLTEADVQARVREEMFSYNQRQAALNAYGEWANENPDFGEHDEALELMKATTLKFMREDLLSLGISADDLAPIANNVDAMSAAHGYHNMEGRLRSYKDLLNASSQHVRNIYRPLGAKPVSTTNQPSPEQQKREQEKVSIQQPKHGTARVASPKPQAPPTAEEIVAKMRQQRGFTVS